MKSQGINDSKNLNVAFSDRDFSHLFSLCWVKKKKSEHYSVLDQHAHTKSFVLMTKAAKGRVKANKTLTEQSRFIVEKCSWRETDKGKDKIAITQRL